MTVGLRERVQRAHVKRGVLGHAEVVTLGRFELRAPLGRGGMGSVYEGFDPDLSRAVAIKVLREDLAPAGLDARLREEAQAMAQLSHPHVLPVFEVGDDGGLVYIVMDLVRGTTLREWLDDPQPWRRIVDVFAQAGEGLAAAHRQGIVHRDFKPENVLLGVDGRARVADFGLARRVVSIASADDFSLDGSTTTRGAGTPRYMAPEVLGGEDASARSDQFSFCVALMEALFGQRPPRGAEVPPPPATARDRVPRRLRRVVERGTAGDPNDRYPDMDALLTAMSVVTRSRRGRLVWAGLAVGLAVGSMTAIGASTARRSGPACDSGAARLELHLRAEGRDRLHDVLRSIDAPWAGATAAAVQRRLDAFARDWIDVQQQACRMSAEQTPQWREYTTSCLDGAAHRTGRVVELLATADASRLRHASATLASASSPPSRCLAPPPLALEEPEPAALVIELADVTALALTGAASEAEAAAKALLERAQAQSAPRVWLVAHDVLAISVELAGDDARAVELAKTTALAAIEHGQDDVVPRLAERVATIYAAHLSDASRAAPWAEISESFARREGASPAAELFAARAAAIVAHAEGRDAEVLERILRAAHEAPEVLDKFSDVVAIENLASIVLEAVGRYDEAAQWGRRSLATFERELGPRHPRVADLLISLGNYYRSGGDSDAAVEHIRRALAIYEENFGDDHRDIWLAHTALAGALANQDRPQEALRHSQQGTRAMRLGLEPGHAWLRQTLANEAGMLVALEREEEALALAREVQETGPESGHDVISVQTLVMTAEVELGRERWAEALEVLARVDAAVEAFPSPLREERTVLVHMFRFDALYGLERYKDARAEVEAAKALVGAHPSFTRSIPWVAEDIESAEASLATRSK